MVANCAKLGKVADPASAASSKRIAAEITSSSVPNETKSENDGRPAKKEKKAEYFIELKWSVGRHEGGEWKVTEYSMFVDDIRRGIHNSRAILENSMGENHEYCIHFCLVDSKGPDRKVLVDIITWYWIVDITLMHFNILSQDLANFCIPLWIDAGRRESEYDSMEIEFGESRHSHVKIKQLVKQATGIQRKKHVLFMRKETLHPEASKDDSRRLLNMIYSSFPVIVIAHDEDLTNLGFEPNLDFDGLGLARIGRRFYVGPNGRN